MCVSERTIRDVESIAQEALAAFKTTQNPSDYPAEHWSNRLERLNYQATLKINERTTASQG